MRFTSSDLDGGEKKIWILRASGLDPSANLRGCIRGEEDP